MPEWLPRKDSNLERENQKPLSAAPEGPFYQGSSAKGGGFVFGLDVGSHVFRQPVQCIQHADADEQAEDGGGDNLLP